jgi:hypothetical protein
MAETFTHGCSHDSSAYQTCAAIHQCVECKNRFTGFFRDEHCLNCYPIYAAARSALAKKVLSVIEAQGDLENAQWDQAVDACLTALRDLFRSEGVEISD